MWRRALNGRPRTSGSPELEQAIEPYGTMPLSGLLTTRWREGVRVTEEFAMQVAARVFSGHGERAF